jgi:AcrR family transcriptional regulator
VAHGTGSGPPIRPQLDVRGGRYGGAMPLTRPRIIGAAMDLIERNGADAVTMRSLATELGCGVVALYSHVPSVDALLDGVADAVAARIRPLTSAGWQDQLVAQARAFRAAARAHPRCVALAVSRPATSTARLRQLEYALAALRAAGIDRADAVRVVHAFAAYAVGSLLREASTAPSTAGTVAGGPEPARIPRRLAAAQFPNVADLTPELTRQDPDADFEFGLRLLVRATAALLPGADQTAA